MIHSDAFYKHKNNEDLILCGACWQKDIDKTKAGEYTGDEAMYESDMVFLSQAEPYQCDGCLVQNDAYDELGDEPD